jgi:hypothetical protein
MLRLVCLFLILALGSALAVVIGVILLNLVVVVIVDRRRQECPRCRMKTLDLTNSFRRNPPPNRVFFTCKTCGGQFIQVKDNQGEMIPREGSSWEDDPGWMDRRKDP